MRKQVLFMVVLLAAMSLIAGVAASSASAFAGGFASPCDVCHTAGGAAPTVLLVTNDGTTATYSVDDATAHEWAVFNGATRINGTGTGGNTATGGTFTVPVGATYNVYAVYGEPAAASSGVTTVSPAGVTDYTITPTAGEHGSITPTGAQTVASGGDVTFTITPDAGYHVADVLVDGSSVGTLTTYTFSNVTTNHTISATFAADSIPTFTIEATAGANGTITPAGSQTVNQGADVTFTIKPNTGYRVATLTVDGNPVVPPVKSFTFKTVTANHTIMVTFETAPKACTITATVVGTGGSIMPNLPVYSVGFGGGVTYYFIADAGYHVDQVLVDGAPVVLDDDNAYTFEAVDQNHTVSASFALNTWTVSATAGANGSISPAGDTAVAEGEDATYTVTPNAGYHISDVKVDGVSLGVLTSYTFQDVTEAHTIAATFAADAVNYTITSSVVGVGGAVSPNVPFTVTSGGSLIVYFLPDDGFVVGTVTVDGTVVPASELNDDDSYTFWNVKASHTVTVSFLVAPIPTYTITASAGTGGSISPAGAVTVNEDQDKTFTITPNAGYAVDDVLVNGQSVGAVTSYTFNKVEDDQTIAASFMPITYTVTATAGAGGSISPSGDVTLNHGADQIFTVTPDAGYEVATFLVDGVAATLNNNTYTLSNVQAAHTVAVTFQVRVEKSSLTLSLSGPKSGVLRFHKSITAKGLLKPARAATVKLTAQRKINGKWRTAATRSRTANATSGAYSLTYKPSKKGTYRVHTTVAKSTNHTSATSVWKTFRVK